MKFSPFKKSKSKGAALVEYGLLVGLISVAAIGAVLTTGQKVDETFVSVQSSLENNQSVAVSGAVAAPAPPPAPSPVYNTQTFDHYTGAGDNPFSTYRVRDITSNNLESICRAYGFPNGSYQSHTTVTARAWRTWNSTGDSWGGSSGFLGYYNTIDDITCQECVSDCP